MDNEEVLIEHLGDKYSRAILSLTYNMECSAIQLCRELDIPLPTVYRKLKILEDTGLIRHVKTVIHLSGNEEKYYRCAINEAIVSFQKGVFSVSLKRENYSDKIIRLWKRFAHPNV